MPPCPNYTVALSDIQLNKFNIESLGTQDLAACRPRLVSGEAIVVRQPRTPSASAIENPMPLSPPEMNANLLTVQLATRGP